MGVNQCIYMNTRMNEVRLLPEIPLPLDHLVLSPFMRACGQGADKFDVHYIWLSWKHLSEVCAVCGEPSEVFSEQRRDCRAADSEHTNTDASTRPWLLLL